jgi:cyclophilin family peptidyl-prolyl cis-trans isomerase/protein-disulfide isomerase
MKSETSCNPARRRQSRAQRWPWLVCAALFLAACAPQAATPTLVPTAWVPIPLNTATTPAVPSAALETAVSGTPLPTLAPIAPITDADWTRGPADAPITLLLYSDFDCEACVDLALVLNELQALHPDDIRLVLRVFPLLTIREKSALAAQAAASASEQGHFWEMHDLLFSRYDEWSALTLDEFPVWLIRAASAAGVDAAILSNDLETRQFEPFVAEAYNQAVAAGIPGAPYLFFNRDLFMLPQTLENLEANVRLTLLTERQFASPPDFNLDLTTDYYARIRLNIGEVILDLYEDTAPQAVNSFVFLAQNGWYDNTPAFQVVRGQYVEFGDPTGTGFGTPGYSYGLESSPAITFDQPGVVGMAGEDPSTNGSRFFVALTALPMYDGERTILGQVVSGLDLLDALAARDPLADLLVTPQAVIQNVVIEAR